MSGAGPRAALIALLGFAAAGIAVWLVPASIHVVEWTDEGPRRLALLASRTRLLAALSVSAAVGAAFYMRRLAGAGWLCLLWLWVVPYLPWIPDRFPLLLILAGPIRWVVAALAVTGCAAAAWRGRVPGLAAWSRAAASAPWLRPRPLVFAASLAVYLVFGALHARAIGPGGDEPHYLIIAHSLLADGDLRIENNHAARDYASFWGGPPLRPDYMTRGLDGEIYSIHAPGLAALVLPVYAALGYGGVVAFLCLLAALTALAVFDLAREVAGPGAAAAAWAAVALTVPFMPHAWLIYPELPGALVVAWAALWVWRGPDAAGAAVWFLRGLAIGLLPWLHTKFVIFLAVFGGALLVPLRRRPSAAAAFAAPVAVSVAAWLGFFYAIYGSFNPEAPYGDYPRLYVLMRNVPRGLLGLLFDQKFGLIVYAPIYLFAIAGAWRLLREPRWRVPAAVLLAATALHVGSTTRLYMWWGGNSAPARFLVPILPCLAPAIAAAAARLRSPAMRTLLGTALGASVIVALAGLADPERLLLFSDPRGRGRIVELVQGPAPLAYLLPTFAQEDWQQPLRALLPWLAAAGVTAAAIRLARRGDARQAPLRTLALALLLFLASSSLLAARVPVEGRLDAATRGVVAVMWRYDPQRLRPLDYARLARVDQNAVFELSRVRADVARGAPDAGQRMILGPITLPAGSYEARVWLAEGQASSGEVTVAAGERAILARAAGGGPDPVVIPFQLPVSARRLTIGAAGDVARDAVRAELGATALVPPRERETAGIRTIESIPDHPGAYVAYTNEHAYPEGGVFWTRGTGEAAVLVAVGGARRLSLTLFSGPTGADCTVGLAGAPQTVHMTAGEIATVSFLVPPGRRLLPLTVRASAFFRPSDTDPGSTDTRGLGCQVRIGLE